MCMCTVCIACQFNLKKKPLFEKRLSFKEQLLLNESTNSTLSLMYDQINRRAFNNELPKIAPKISTRLKRATGTATAQALGGKLVGIPKISISNLYELDNKALTMVLAHEMIHVYFYMQNDFKENHGYRFKAQAMRVGSILGMTIPITHDTTNLKIQRKTKADILVMRTNDKLLVMLLKLNTIKSISDALELQNYIKTRGRYDIIEAWVVSGEFALEGSLSFTKTASRPNIYDIHRNDKLKQEIFSKKVVKVI